MIIWLSIDTRGRIWAQFKVILAEIGWFTWMRILTQTLDGLDLIHHSKYLLIYIYKWILQGCLMNDCQFVDIPPSNKNCTFNKYGGKWFLSHRWLLHNLQDGRYEEKAACKKNSTFRKLSTTVESISGRYFLDRKIAHPEQHFAASLFSMRIDFRVIFLAGRLYLSSQGNHWRNTRRACGL